MFSCQDVESVHKTAFHPSALCLLSWHILIHNSLDKMLLSSKTTYYLCLFGFVIAKSQGGSGNVIVWVLCLELRTQVKSRERSILSVIILFYPQPTSLFSVLSVFFFSSVLFEEKQFECSISNSDQAEV